MREHFVPGWRMYYPQRGGVLIVLLGGDDKSSQSTDISKAAAIAATLEEWAMNDKKIHISTLPEFDMARYLTSEEDIADYLTMVIEEGDASELAHALGVAACARGMSEVAKAAGITREALSKALRPNANPRFKTSAGSTQPWAFAWWPGRCTNKGDDYTYDDP